jgi:hypothetical protein
MKNVNIWFFVWMAFVGVVLSFCNLNPLQFGVLVFMFSAADLIGGPTKRALDGAKSPRKSKRSTGSPRK